MTSSKLWSELNVTEIGYGNVEQNSIADQSNDIIEAFKSLGNPVGIGDPKKYFSKTIYFPAGTYYFSENLLNLVLGAGSPVVTEGITIRGDGPGRTILKLMSNAFDLADFANIDWLNPNSSELSVPGSASDPNDQFDSAVLTVPQAQLPANADQVYVSVRMPGENIPVGSSFELIVNGTVIGSLATTATDMKYPTFMLMEGTLPALGTGEDEFHWRRHTLTGWRGHSDLAAVRECISGSESAQKGCFPGKTGFPACTRGRIGDKTGARADTGGRCGRKMQVLACTRGQCGGKMRARACTSGRLRRKMVARAGADRLIGASSQVHQVPVRRLSDAFSTTSGF